MNQIENLKNNNYKSLIQKVLKAIFVMNHLQTNSLKE